MGGPIRAGCLGRAGRRRKRAKGTAAGRESGTMRSTRKIVCVCERERECGCARARAQIQTCLTERQCLISGVQL